MAAAAAKVAASRTHDAIHPTELSFSFAELLLSIYPELYSSPPEASLSTEVRMYECAVAVRKNRGHRHQCGHRSRRHHLLSAYPHE